MEHRGRARRASMRPSGNLPMSVSKPKATRRSCRWMGWDEKPLESRQLMSAVPPAAEVLAARAQAHPQAAGHLRGRLASSFATYLTVTNRTEMAVKLRVTDIDNYDWDGVSRPDHNLDGLVLAPGQSTTQREEISRGTTPNFTLSLVDANTGETIATARATMRWTSSHDYQYRFWDLNPEYQKVSHGGKSLSLYAKLGSKVDPMTGTFILEDTAQVPRARRRANAAGRRVATTVETSITVRNTTGIAVRIGVSEIDNYDWEDNRPDHNLDGVILGPGQSITRQEDINGWASPNFRITLYDAATGAQVVTARASYFDPLGHGINFMWMLDPQRQTFDHGGEPLAFWSEGVSLRLMGQGVFSLTSATSLPRRHRHA